MIAVSERFHGYMTQWHPVTSSDIQWHPVTCSCRFHVASCPGRWRGKPYGSSTSTSWTGETQLRAQWRYVEMEREPSKIMARVALWCKFWRHFSQNRFFPRNLPKFWTCLTTGCCFLPGSRRMVRLRYVEIVGMTFGPAMSQPCHSTSHPAPPAPPAPRWRSTGEGTERDGKPSEEPQGAAGSDGSDGFDGSDDSQRGWSVATGATGATGFSMMQVATQSPLSQLSQLSESTESTESTRIPSLDWRRNWTNCQRRPLCRCDWEIDEIFRMYAHVIFKRYTMKLKMKMKNKMMMTTAENKIGSFLDRLVSGPNKSFQVISSCFFSGFRRRVWHSARTNSASPA